MGGSSERSPFAEKGRSSGTAALPRWSSSVCSSSQLRKGEITEEQLDALLIDGSDPDDESD